MPMDPKNEFTFLDFNKKEVFHYLDTRISSTRIDDDLMDFTILPKILVLLQDLCIS